MDMMILDFRKAFDKVPHQLVNCSFMVFREVHLYGLNLGSLVELIIDGECSKSVDVTSGVPKGTVLGPLMFLLFINDTQHDLECTLRLFADDALLYHKITFHDDILALQRDLDKLGLLADRWQMLFNPSKCYKMSVSVINL